MLADMVGDYLGHQAVHRAARGDHQVQHLGAALFSLQRALDRLDLAAYPPHPRHQPGLLTDRVAHLSYTLPGIVWRVQPPLSMGLPARGPTRTGYAGRAR